MKLILIHGRAQEDYEEQALKQKWIATLNEGLAKSGLSLPSGVQIEFPYYGKLLDQLVQDAKTAPKDTSDAHRSGQVYEEAKEIEFVEAMLGEMAMNIEATRAEKAELKKSIEKDRGLLNWEPLQRLFSYIDKKQKFGDAILKNFTLDVFMYLTIRDIRTKIDNRILQTFDNEPCVVVGHSLGSVVSYLILKNHPQFQVKKFITVGSPLGLAAIQKYLELPLQVPSCIKDGDWFNAFDSRDFVALNPLNRQYFNVRPPIENKGDVDNHTENRHGIIGYLNDKVVAQQIHAALA